MCITGAQRDAGACECSSEDLQTERMNCRRDFDKMLFGINDRFGGPVVARC
jgi:hypothetical protein